MNASQQSQPDEQRLYFCFYGRRFGHPMKTQLNGGGSIFLPGSRRFGKVWAGSLAPDLVLAHATGVNSLIWVILAAGKRVNKYFK